eukprot:TRINITY_DN22004_c0_g1_i2.p1 TRINITY_DN22004_c0_g1~~TRINITY_DN22004_c0_g1_i2.p1  ORF type:complete len:504 (+),score=103.49 TRINITY_DN22004_c0_g1_i2:93-1604(+)
MDSGPAVPTMGGGLCEDREAWEKGMETPPGLPWPPEDKPGSHFLPRWPGCDCDDTPQPSHEPHAPCSPLLHPCDGSRISPGSQQSTPSPTSATFISPPGLDEPEQFEPIVDVPSEGLRTPPGEQISTQREALLLQTPPSGYRPQPVSPGFDTLSSPLTLTPVRTPEPNPSLCRPPSLTPSKHSLGEQPSAGLGEQDLGKLAALRFPSLEKTSPAPRAADSVAAERQVLGSSWAAHQQPHADKVATTAASSMQRGTAGTRQKPLPVGLQLPGSCPSSEAEQAKTVTDPYVGRRSGQGQRSSKPSLHRLVPAPDEKAVAVAAEAAAQKLSAAAAAAWVAAAAAAAAVKQPRSNRSCQSIPEAAPAESEAEAPVDWRNLSGMTTHVAAAKHSHDGHVDGGFTFTLRKADGIELGLSVSHVFGQPPLVVNAVRPGGAVEAWNKLCVGPRASRAVMPGDHVICVNDVTDVRGILEEMRRKVLLRFEVWRPTDTVNEYPDLDHSGPRVS